LQTLTQSVLSTEPIQMLVQANSPDGPYDPTADAVQFAFTNANAYPATAPTEWYAGSWVTYPGNQYWAQVLIGPANGGVALATGTWAVWIMITDNPDVPVRQPLLLQIV
jgi:hypothetical protein